GLDPKDGLASLITLTIFFTSSSVTPIIAPWETRQRTLEMLLSRPVKVTTILIGDILASTIFGLVFTLPIVIYSIVLGAVLSNVLMATVIIMVTVIGFSALGVLFSALPTDTPADVVLLSSAVKLPLIFVSGVLVPLAQLPTWILAIAAASPLTYPTDLLRRLYTGNAFFPEWVDIMMVIIFTIMFMAGALKLHEKTLSTRLQKK
ncbi:MAG: ABC transporter permease, partial [Candidatus Brockarchaeota archaeon]|nr:ABC transporter permease [Candidatus Brockarchaeota archaeon]